MKSRTLNKEIYKELGFTLLAEGTTIRVRADGYSMYPTIKPGSMIVIDPITGGGAIIPGDIVAWKRESGLVVHRLVRIIERGEDVIIITRGDSCRYPDQPGTIEDIAGRVVEVEDRKGKIISGKSLKKNQCYFYNRFIVWVLLRKQKYLGGSE